MKWVKNGGRPGIVRCLLFCLFFSSTITLRLSAQVGPAPVITAQPVNRIVIAGGTTALSVDVVSGTNPTFKWRLNGSYISGANQSTLQISNAQPAIAGIYSVEVRNAGGKVASSDAVITVLTQPITILPLLISPSETQVTVTGPAGFTYLVETSTDAKTWTRILTNPAPTGITTFIDTTVPKSPYRFYRALVAKSDI